MRVQNADLVVNTNGKGTYEITDEIQSKIDQSGVRNGTVTVFVQHTSCSLIAMENAAPAARRDLERFFDKLVPEDQEFEHDDEGPDDMPSHIRMSVSDYHPKKAFGAAILPERSRSRALGGGSADARRGRSLARCQAEAGRRRSGSPRLTSSEPS